MGFHSGPYNWTFNELPLGITADAPILTPIPTGAPVTADLFGGEPVDEIYTGMTATMQMVFQEIDETGLVALLNTHGINNGQVKNLGCPMGEQLSDVLLGTVSNNASCSDITKKFFIAYRAVIAANTPIEMLRGGRLQQVPVLFNLWPYVRDSPQGSDSIHLYEWLATLPGDVSRDGAVSLSLATTV